MIRCPYHNENNPSFGICLEGSKRGLFQCLSHNCGTKGTFFHLIAHLDGITLDQAVEKFDIKFDLKYIRNLKNYFITKLKSSNGKIKIINEKKLQTFKGENYSIKDGIVIVHKNSSIAPGTVI